MTGRFCPETQRVEEVDSNGFCTACGKRVIGWISDHVSYPNEPPTVEGDDVTEEI